MRLRHHVQGAPASCRLAVGSESFDFQACTQPSPEAGDSFQIFYSLSASPGGAGTVWRGGIRANAAKYPAGRWAG
jgi:hypothetical protein